MERKLYLWKNHDSFAISPDVPEIWDNEPDTMLLAQVFKHRLGSADRVPRNNREIVNGIIKSHVALVVENARLREALGYSLDKLLEANKNCTHTIEIAKAALAGKEEV